VLKFNALRANFEPSGLQMRRREFIARLSAAGAGGTLANPTYKQVCSDTTGHAEVVQVTHDPAKASSDRLLDVWPCHVKSGISPSVAAELAKRRHRLILGRDSYGGYQAILRDKKNGVY
jgi:hypothetical protein